MHLNQGDAAPKLALHDQDRKVRRLEEFLGKGNVILAFFPGAFTSVCTHELCTLRDSLSKLSFGDAQVIGISVNDPWTLKGFASANSLTFPLLSDYSREAVKAFGVELKDFGGLNDYTAAQRAVFVLDKAGIIRFAWIAPQPGVEPDYKQLEDMLGRAK